MAPLPTEGELRKRNGRNSVLNEPSVADKSSPDSGVREPPPASFSSATPPTEHADVNKGRAEGAVSGVAEGIATASVCSKYTKWFRTVFRLSLIIKIVGVILALVWALTSYRHGYLQHTRVHMAACQQHPENGYLQNTEICMAMAGKFGNDSAISMSSLDLVRRMGQIGNLENKVFFWDKTWTIHMPIDLVIGTLLTLYYLWFMFDGRHPFEGLVLYSIFQYTFGAWRVPHPHDDKEQGFLWGWLFQRMRPDVTDDYREVVGCFRYNLLFPVVGYCLCKCVVASCRFIPPWVVLTNRDDDSRPREKRERPSNPRKKGPTGWFLLAIALATTGLTTSLLAPLSRHLTPETPAIAYLSFDQELDDAAKALDTTPWFVLTEVRFFAVKIWKAGEYRQGEKIFRQILRGYENWVGSEHKHAIAAAHNLGQAAQRLQKHSEAASLHRRVLKSHEARYGGDSSEAIQAKLELSFALHEDGDFSESIALRYEVANWQHEHLGPASLEALVSWDSIGLSMVGVEAYEAAESMHRRALVGKRETLGDRHPQTLATLNNLGTTMATAGKYDEAEQVLQDVLRLREAVLGAEHLHALETVYMLGVVMNELGRAGEAEHLLRRALHGRSKRLGIHHPQTRDALQHLVNMLGKQGRDEDARRLIESLKRKG